MTSRLLARRPLQLGGLLLAATTLGMATAPAALAEETPAPQTDPSATTSAPEVLPPAATTTATGTDGPASTTDGTAATTTAPSSATSTSAAPSTAAAATETGPDVVAGTTTPTGAHFGTGKLNLYLDTSEDELPDGVDLDVTGAQLELRFSQVDGAPSTAHGICDVDAGLVNFPFGSSCEFQPGSTVPTENYYGLAQVPSLPADSVFTLTLVTPPSSGQLLDAPMSIQGYTDSSPAPVGDSSDLGLPVLHGYRTLGVSVVDGAPAGTQVQLCPEVAGACATGSTPVVATTDAAGRATFDGRYLPGDYLVTRGGTSTAFAVPAATSTTERDAVLRATVGVPVAPPTTAPRTTGTATAAAPTVAAGRQQTITAGGFTPGETARGTLYSTPVDLGTAVADAQGMATFTFTLPAGFEPGTHTVTAVGLTSGATSSVTFTVTSGSTPALAQTGVEVAPLLGLGALALGGGAALTVAGTRRRRTA
ncbi:hypothetical protein [Klenkia brasiliensis]|uniref:Gram-positive cocci surface proteins LPxTG domain-containing protein n=1 Tax=Klenkia brasiliensis TaxID=333142 RepID=A0A1G7ML59_9ACTN|nr:hypothetical protein [Klenkia brasiliensis]SDF61869.1 hypothetical protein SAMN05660324_0673 [Klenkia brasiliensis]